MSQLQSLIARKNELDRLIAERQTAERNDALNRIRVLMTEHGLTTADLVLASIGRTPRELPPKYHNRTTGQTWSGRGPRPRWVKDALRSGQDLEDFAARH